MADDNQPDLPTPPKGAHVPAAMLTPRAAGEGDASAEANARAAAEAAEKYNRSIPAEQLVTRSTGEPTRAMWVIVGPYRGSVLTMPDAEAEDAKDSHWAINMSDMQAPFDANSPLDHDHELTDEDRAYAVEAANAWAQAQWDPEEPDEPAPEGETAEARTEREKRNADRQKRNADRQTQRKPERPQETDEQRQAREKRRQMQSQQPRGGYVTRAPAGRAARPDQPKQ